MTVEGAKWVGRWEGGRIREARGKRVFVIERRVLGKQTSVRLDVSSEREALAELALFERDPVAYRTRGQAKATAPGAARIEPETLEAFLKHAIEQGLTPAYVKDILGTYLTAWGAVLKGRDLRTVQLAELRALLARWKTAKRHRIVALKSFTTWLREEARLPRAEDPTIDLKVPQPKAEKSVRAKGYEMPAIELLYAEIPSQLLRDTLCLRAKTGMHDTEIGRIARGEAELREVRDPSGIFGTLTFRHLKAGKVHVVSVDAQTFAAARRLAARGSPLSRNAAKVMIDRAAKRLGVPSIQPGELRHSFATWARQTGKVVRPADGGVSLDEIAAVMGHTSARTTQVFYVGDKVPPMIALPLQLQHPEDPTPLGGQSDAPVALSTAARRSLAS
ncbi:tyrosine-type recombinase/integrase [Myxococcus fulvus]|uniref:tyrosine-type recombinase/integrase n=1 Tax=Myxococcus fulvus TaxID=33 RepID=UPI0020BDACFD|nr:tyrosine-type recombinase/integrase [Myxococcus fulvus]MCK8501562.1 site-specific integrase [Myxococcus fulvus]